MINRLIVLLAISSLIASCSPLYRDLSRYELDTDEKREWKLFESNDLNLTLKYPAELTVKDSDDLKNAIHLYSIRNHDMGGRFNMLIKIHQGFSFERLKNLEEYSIVGTRNGGNSGMIEYGKKEAFFHEYADGNFRYYQLIYQIDDDLYSVNFSSDDRFFREGTNKMHKILTTLQAE